MTLRRTIVISDVHGCLDELQALLKACSYSPDDDLLVFVGDLLDKGPKPHETVRYVRQLRHVVLVLGNHEDKHIRYRGHERRREKSGKSNPCLDRHGELAAFYAAADDEDYAFLNQAVVAYTMTEHNHVVVHAGIPPRLKALPPEGRPWSSFTKSDKKKWGGLKWARCVDARGNLIGVYDTQLHHRFWCEDYDGRFGTVIYGHLHRVTEDGSFIETEHARGIDTGCVYGGRLTGLVFSNHESCIGQPIVVQVDGSPYADDHAEYLAEARKTTPPFP